MSLETFVEISIVGHRGHDARIISDMLSRLFQAGHRNFQIASAAGTTRCTLILEDRYTFGEFSSFAGDQLRKIMESWKVSGSVDIKPCKIPISRCDD